MHIVDDSKLVLVVPKHFLVEHERQKTRKSENYPRVFPRTRPEVHSEPLLGEAKGEETAGVESLVDDLVREQEGGTKKIIIPRTPEAPAPHSHNSLGFPCPCRPPASPCLPTPPLFVCLPSLVPSVPSLSLSFTSLISRSFLSPLPPLFPSLP
jgi:hypothetical protein